QAWKTCFREFFFLLCRGPPSSTLFPYTTLFRSRATKAMAQVAVNLEVPLLTVALAYVWGHPAVATVALGVRTTAQLDEAIATLRDRKSTRLNSSHVKISYAVFCLKKKKSVRPDD